MSRVPGVSAASSLCTRLGAGLPWASCWGAPAVVWVKAGLVVAAPSLLSARAAAGKYMILQKWHLSVLEELLHGGAVLRAGLYPAVLSHSWTLLVPHLFLGKSPKTPAKGERKIVSKVQSLSWCISFCLE